MAKKKPRSLRTKMLAIMLLCWLLPVILALGSISYYVFYNYNRRIEGEFADGLAAGMQITADRLDSAVAKLRRTAYDGTVRDSWLQWKNGEFEWISLYSRTVKYISGQYLSDERFPIIAFWFAEKPEEMRVGVYVEAASGSFRQLSQFWEEDYAGAAQLAAGLDTYVGVYENEGRVYLVRNLTHNFEVIGTQVIALNGSSFFDGLLQMAMNQSLCLWLDGNRLVLDGPAVELSDFGLSPETRQAVQGKTQNGGRYCYDTISGDGFTMSALIQIDRSILFQELLGYQTILIAMVLFLGPLLIVYYRLYERNITTPMRQLMGGAQKVEQGQWGYQLSVDTKSREFQYILDSFNRMSGRLKEQFEQIYREELSLRDARIKALQSQINPHFLNNTLEIINWEARMNGDVKVSRMIEALSTLLDAAMDRDMCPEVPFREELSYIDAYLYIADQRFGKRLTVERDIDSKTLDYRVPRLILQPIVENAMEHGMPAEGNGRVRLSARLDEGCLLIDVENNRDMSAEDEARIARLLSPDYDPSTENSYNLGIANVNQRLRILYGAPSGLTIQRLAGGGVVAHLIIARKNHENEA